MDRAMTRQSQIHERPLCPHLAAAVLWMSKSNRSTRRGKPRIRYARAYGQATDDLLAL
jgi:hypothetical protein